MSEFSAAWRRVAQMAWRSAEDHGFHDNYEIGTKLCLMHAEISEALEAIRNGNPPSEKIPGYSHVEEEMADLIIRVMDEAVSQKWDLGGALFAKMRYNQGRPFKHGEKF